MLSHQDLLAAGVDTCKKTSVPRKSRIVSDLAPFQHRHHGHGVIRVAHYMVYGMDASPMKLIVLVEMLSGSRPD
jgi:hypothetical protein